MFQKKHPRLVSHSFFLPYPIPWTHPGSCTSRLGKVLSSIGGATLRKEAGGGNPATRSHGAQGTLQSSCSPETPPSFWGTRVGSAAGGSPGSGDCGLMQTGTGSPCPSGWVAHWLAYPPQRPQPQDSPTCGPSLLRPQGCDPAQIPKA